MGVLLWTAGRHKLTIIFLSISQYGIQIFLVYVDGRQQGRGNTDQYQPPGVLFTHRVDYPWAPGLGRLGGIY